MLICRHGTLKRGYFTDRGYFCGPGAEIDGINFINEAAINPTASLSFAETWTAGLNSNIKGYICGLKIDGFTFGNETYSSVSVVLPVPRNGAGGVNDTLRGFCGGGPQGVSQGIEIDGITFSSETTINPSAVLVTEGAPTGTPSGASSSLKGYFGCSRQNAQWNVTVSTLDFSTLTAGTSSHIGVARGYATSVNSQLRAYWCGGTNGTYTTRIDSTVFSTETASTVGAVLSVARYGAGGVNNNSKGYVGGGSGPVNKIDGLNFSNNTMANPSSILSTSRVTISGVQSGGYL